MVGIKLAEKPERSNPSPSSRILEQIQSKGYYGFYPNENWTPSVNLYEIEAAYLVCVDLAGVEKNKIDIEVEGNRLRLRGNRAVPTSKQNGDAEAPTGAPHQARLRVHLMEIDYGPFARDVELPNDVRHDAINAKYLDGLLWIELPKKNAEQ
jgi:HSP20 family protein